MVESARSTMDEASERAVAALHAAGDDMEALTEVSSTIEARRGVATAAVDRAQARQTMDQHWLPFNGREKQHSRSRDRGLCGVLWQWAAPYEVELHHWCCDSASCGTT